MPDDDAGGDADIQGMFRPELGNLQTAIARIHYILSHTFHLVAQHDRVFLRLLWMKIL